MDKCRGCEAFPKCTAQAYGDVTCRYLRFSYGMDGRTEMTNADRIRAMSDEELARWLEYEGGGACAEMCGWLNWLQQQAETSIKDERLGGVNDTTDI